MPDKGRAHFFLKSMKYCGFNSAMLIFCFALLCFLCWLVGTGKTEFQCRQEQWYIDHLDPHVRKDIEERMGHKMQPCQ